MTVDPIAPSTPTTNGHSPETGTWTAKRGLAQMLKGGVIMDVVTADQAKIAEDAGAVAVMALERVPADIRRDGGVARIGHEETRRLLLRDDDPARPAPEETFQDRRTLEIGGERIELAWHGSNHSPDNIFIHLPDHDTLMLVDIVNPGWAPVYQSNLTEDVPGYIAASDTALTYPWKHFIGGHMGRLGTREDIAVHQRYMDDIADSSRRALDTVDPTPYFVRYGENTWAAVRGYLDAVTHAL